MPKHTRKLLFLAALCWVVPASASQLPLAEGQLKQWPSCPVARAKLLAEPRTSPSRARTVIFVSRSDAMGPRFGASRAFQP
jgi:hypothetical protein